MLWTNRERRHVSSTLQGVSDRKQELESSKKFLREGGSCWMRVWRTQQHKGTLASIHSTVTEVNKFWLLCSRGLKQAWEGTAGLRDAGWDMGQAKGDQAGGTTAVNYRHLKMTLALGFCPPSSSHVCPWVAIDLLWVKTMGDGPYFMSLLGSKEGIDLSLPQAKWLLGFHQRAGLSLFSSLTLDWRRRDPWISLSGLKELDLVEARIVRVEQVRGRKDVELFCTRGWEAAVWDKYRALERE